MDQRRVYDKYVFLVLSEIKTIIFKSYGKIELLELMNKMDRLKENPKFKSSYNFLVDLRDVDYQKSAENVKAFADYVQKDFSGSLKRRIAFVTSTLDQIAMASMFKIYQPKNMRNIRVFSDFDDASMWVSDSLNGEKLEVLIEKKLPEDFKENRIKREPGLK